MILLKSWCVQTIQRVEETLIHCTTPYQLGLRLDVILNERAIFRSMSVINFYFIFFLTRSLHRCVAVLEVSHVSL